LPLALQGPQWRLGLPPTSRRIDEARTGDYTPAMLERGPAVPRLALTIGVIGMISTIGAFTSACRKSPTVVDPPDDTVRVDTTEQVDAPAVCTSACQRLERCVPELAVDIDGDHAVVAKRLATECPAACAEFEDQRTALAVRDCSSLESCTAFWGCVATDEARPWLAAVTPVGERTCENLCGQASACAIAKVCETGAGSRKRKPDADAPAQADTIVDPECMRDQVRRDELDEQCLLQCRALPETSRARSELIGCIDHVSCGGLLGCLDGWASTDYEDATGPTPGISETCDNFCTRAIVCGAADSEVELEPAELDELKQVMTSTYVECAVQCAKDLEGGADSDSFEACAAVETCEQFDRCADEV
jgi:hypothetical protein